MRNQTNNVFKVKRQKSKIFITILCIFGLLFSYSCSCKNRVSNPDDTPTDSGVITNKEGGIVITPSATLSTNLMIINVNGNGTKQSITITVNNADFEIADITGVEGLTKNDFNLTTNGVLSLTSGFDKVDTTEKTLTLVVNYQKKSTAGENDTLSKNSENFDLKIIKAESLADDKIQTLIRKMTTVGSFNVANLELKSGKATLYENDAVNIEIKTSDFEKQLNNRLQSKNIEIITGFEFVKVDVSIDKKTATFEFILKVEDKYETIYNSKENPITFIVVIGDNVSGQGGTGTWKDDTSKDDSTKPKS